MRRTVLAPTTVATASRARHVLLAVSLAALLTLALTLAVPVAAQEDETTNQEQTVTRDKNASGKQEQSVQGSGQRAEEEAQADDEQAADPLKGQTANINADSIGPIAVAGCEAVAGETTSITVTDESGEAGEEFVDNAGVVFQFGEQDITINAEEDEPDLTNRFGDATAEITGEVVRSNGIVCDDSGGGQRAAAANTAADDENTARTEDLESLSCPELLVLFRSEGAQYGDAAGFADADVRARVEVCL